MAKRFTLEYFQQQGRKGGKLSGEARLEKLTPEQRSEIARNAVTARWAKKAAEQPATDKPKPRKAAAKKATKKRSPAKRKNQKPPAES